MAIGGARWSRRAFPDSPFPSPSFPSGIGTPPAVLLLAILAVSGCLAATGSSWAAAAIGYGPADPRAVVVALTLALAAVAAYAVLRRVVVTPVRRLLHDVESVAAGRPRDRVRRSRFREIDQVAEALGAPAGGVRGLPIVVGLAGAASLVAAGALGGLALAAGANGGAPAAPVPATNPPAQLDATGSAQDVQDALNGGLADLQTLVAPISGESIGDFQRTLDDFYDDGNVFRSVYLADAAGRPAVVAGLRPRLPARSVPVAAGLSQLNRDGPAPIVVAAAPFYDGEHTVVAEFDEHALNDVLREAGVSTRVVDAGMRTVLDTGGYLAFDEVTDPVVRAAVAGARSDPPGGDVVAAAAASVIAARRVGGGDPAAALNWVVEQDVAVGAAVPAGPPADAPLVVATGFALGVTGLVVAWVHMVTVRPLRRTAARAAALVAGAPVAPLAPQRLDEVGAIAAGLNRCASRARSEALPARPGRAGRLALGPGRAGRRRGVPRATRPALGLAVPRAVPRPAWRVDRSGPDPGGRLRCSSCSRSTRPAASCSSSPGSSNNGAITGTSGASPCGSRSTGSAARVRSRVCARARCAGVVSPRWPRRPGHPPVSSRPTARRSRCTASSAWPTSSSRSVSCAVPRPTGPTHWSSSAWPCCRSCRRSTSGS